MKKRMLLALLLAAVLLLTGGCSLIVKDPEVDKQTVILEVNGQTFLKGEVQPMVEEELEYQQYVYQYQYGMPLDVNDPEVTSYIKEEVIQNLIRQAVLEQKLAESGYTTFTEEEKAAAMESAQAQYESYIEEITAGYLADSDLTGDALRAEAERILAEEQRITLEQLAEYEELNVADEKLYQQITGDAAVTEEELLAAYEARVETAKSDYEYDPQYFDMDMSSGGAVYYRPAGYRYVKHILLGYTEEEKTAIAALEAKLEEAQTALSDLEVQVASGDVLPDDEAYLANHALAEEALLAAERELDAAVEAAAAALMPRVEEVQAAIAAGEDFDALIGEYGEDPGMEAEPAKTQGYMVGESSTNYVDAFRDGAMALSQAGDVSEPVRSEYGMHLIKYVADVEEGPVPFEEVKEQLHKTVLEEEKNRIYNETVNAWVEEADVKTYLKRLDD